MTKAVAVAFLVSHTIGTLYNPGDVAGFEPDVAADLIKRGIAQDAKSKGKTVKLTAKKVGEGWSVFAGSDELVKGLADKNAAAAWIAEREVARTPVARQVGETWSVFVGEDVLVKDLADEEAAKAWITENQA